MQKSVSKYAEKKLLNWQPLKIFVNICSKGSNNTTKISAIKSKNLCRLIKAEIICYWIMDADFAHRALIFFYKNKKMVTLRLFYVYCHFMVICNGIN